MIYIPYIPEVAWTTIVFDVVYENPTTYTLIAIPNDANDPGGATAEKEVGFYLKDYVGHTYSITGINVGGNPNRIRVVDDFGVGVGPQSGMYAYVYKSVGDGTAPWLAPVRHQRLDDSALDYSRAFELDVLWNSSNTNTSAITNLSSNGVLSGCTITINTDNTKINISAGELMVIDDTIPAEHVSSVVPYSGITGHPLSNIAGSSITYLALDSNLDVVEKSVPFTNTERRSHIILGAAIHSNRSYINVINNLPDVGIHIGSQYNDLLDGLRNFNISGNVYSANGANLSLNKSVGSIFKKGVNFHTSEFNPHSISLDPITLISNLRYRTQNGTEYADTSLVDCGHYDLGGTRTPLNPSKYTIQRINLFTSNLTRIQYGQTIYNSMVDAIQAIPTEVFITETNIADNGLLRGLLVVKSTATDLSDVNQARFFQVNKFGEVQTTASGSGTTTLQQAYNNSVQPQTITDSTRGAFQIKRGSALDADKVFEILNGTNFSSFSVTGDGRLVDTHTTSNIAVDSLVTTELVECILANVAGRTPTTRSAALEGRGYDQLGDTNYIGMMYGIRGESMHYGLGGANNIAGVSSWSHNQHGTAVINLMGVDVQMKTEAGAITNMSILAGWMGSYGGTITNQSGCLVPMVNDGANITTQRGIDLTMINTSGTIATRYGIFIDQTGAAANDWGIYQNGIQENYLGGLLCIGDPTGLLYNYGVREAVERLYLIGEATNIASGVAANATVYTEMANVAGRSGTARTTAIEAYIYDEIADTNYMGMMYAINGNAEHHGTGGVNNLAGLSAWVYNSHNAVVANMMGVDLSMEIDAGTITNASLVNGWFGLYGGTIASYRGINFQIDNDGATITNQRGIDLVLTNYSGTVTNRYGIYLNQVGSATNDWGVYQVSSQKNKLGGTLLINTVTDDTVNKLQVNGGILATTIKLTTGATNGYYLKSDASGNASWASLGLDIRTNIATLATGTHTISYSSTLATTNYTLFVTIEQDGFQTYCGFMTPTSATGFDVTIPSGGNAVVTYLATKYI